MGYDAIVFDSDGVIVEPTDPSVHREAVRDALTEFDVTDVTAETIELLVEISGDERDQLSVESVERVCDGHGIDPSDFWRRREQLAAEAQLAEIRTGRKPLYPDVDVLETIDVPLVVVSNNQHETLEHVLGEHGIDAHFEVAYGREPSLEGIGRRKPDSYYAREAIEHVGATEPLLVGDSDVDVRTAERLGIDSVFVRRPHREDYRLTATPTYEIDSLTELPDLL